MNGVPAVAGTESPTGTVNFNDVISSTARSECGHAEEQEGNAQHNRICGGRRRQRCHLPPPHERRRPHWPGRQGWHDIGHRARHLCRGRRPDRLRMPHRLRQLDRPKGAHRRPCRYRRRRVRGSWGGSRQPGPHREPLAHRGPRPDRGRRPTARRQHCPRRRPRRSGSKHAGSTPFGKRLFGKLHCPATDGRSAARRKPGPRPRPA